MIEDDKIEELMYDDDEFSPREAYPWVDRVMAECDANDPTLESYQIYRRDACIAKRKLL
jgi:hypothetical protein